MDSKKPEIQIVTFDEGPPLTNEQVYTLQALLGQDVRVVRKSVEEVLKSPPDDGIIWPYSRGVPNKANDVLDAIDRDKVAIINDYHAGHNLSDKKLNHEIAKHEGIPTPYTISIENISDFEGIDIEYPLVVKGYPSGRGEDVHLCYSRAEAEKAFEQCNAKNLGVIAQEYIRESHGRDLRVLVVNGQIASYFMRQGPEGAFHSNVSQGGSYEPYELTASDHEIIQRVINVFPVDVAGIDFLLTDEGITFNEINLSPGWSKEATAIVPLLAQLVRTRAQISNVLSQKRREST